MAELGVAASVISIVGFALDLSKKLYRFSATTTAAGEEVSYVAKNITNFADALELLAERLDASSKPIYSKHTIRVVDRLYDQSCDLFDEIEELIPKPRYGRSDLNFTQKVLWNFKKARVEFLAGQIECLKTTASLVATVLFAGNRIQSKRSSHKKHKTNLNRVDLEQARERVTIAVVEQQKASDRLSDLHERVAVEDTLLLQSSSSHVSQPDTESAAERMDLVPLTDIEHHILPIHDLIRLNGADSKDIILQINGDDLLLQLLRRFTTLDVTEIGHVTPGSEPNTQGQRAASSNQEEGATTQEPENPLGVPETGFENRHSPSHEAPQINHTLRRPTLKQTSSSSRKTSRNRLVAKNPAQTQLDEIIKRYDPKRSDGSPSTNSLEDKRELQRSAKHTSIDHHARGVGGDPSRTPSKQGERGLTFRSGGSFERKLTEPNISNTKTKKKNSNRHITDFVLPSSTDENSAQAIQDGLKSNHRHQMSDDQDVTSTPPTEFTSGRIALHEIKTEFYSTWWKRYKKFIKNPPSSSAKKYLEHWALYNGISTIVERAEILDLGDDRVAELSREGFLEYASEVLSEILMTVLPKEYPPSY